MATKRSWAVLFVVLGITLDKLAAQPPRRSYPRCNGVFCDFGCLRHITLVTLLRTTDGEAMLWFRNHGIVPDRRQCERCDTGTYQDRVRCRTRSSQAGADPVTSFTYRCTNRRCRHEVAWHGNSGSLMHVHCHVWCAMFD